MLQGAVHLLALGGAAAGVAVVAWAARWLIRNGPTSLADLVRPYRPDGWPTGVQEDDDVRWDWRAERPDRAEDDEPEPTEVSRLRPGPVRRAAR